jgi:hypothetical protein
MLHLNHKKIQMNKVFKMKKYIRYIIIISKVYEDKNKKII